MEECPSSTRTTRQYYQVIEEVLIPQNRSQIVDYGVKIFLGKNYEHRSGPVLLWNVTQSTRHTRNRSGPICQVRPPSGSRSPCKCIKDRIRFCGCKCFLVWFNFRCFAD